jgi:glucokinase
MVLIPGSFRTIAYDPLKRTGVGVSRLGTSKAVAIGAYTFALHKLDKR